MKITLVLVGKTEKSYFVEAFDEYAKRIAKYIRFEVKVIPDLKNTKAMSFEVQMQKEGTAILQAIADSQDVVLLDEHGKSFTSVGFANIIEKKMVTGQKDLCFVIGGPYGFAPEVKAKANMLISLSELTYSHQLVRVVFAEQLYRAFTIIKGEPYHHE